MKHVSKKDLELKTKTEVVFSSSTDNDQVRASLNCPGATFHSKCACDSENGCGTTADCGPDDTNRCGIPNSEHTCPTSDGDYVCPSVDPNYCESYEYCQGESNDCLQSDDGTCVAVTDDCISDADGEESCLAGMCD